jgi:hypothetical protein
MLPATYTVAEIAEALKVSPWWVKKQVKAGLVTPIRLSTAKNAPMRFTEADYQQLLAALTPGVVAPAPTQQKARRRKRRAA